MSLEDFQLLDIEPFDNSINKRDFTKIYHQQGAQLNQSDQNIEFIFGENNNYHQIGKGYLEFDITVRKNDTTNFHIEDPIRLVNNGYAFCCKEARLCTTIGSDIEHNKFCGQVSTIMKVISNKDDDLLSQFGNINENDIPLLERLADLPVQIRDTPNQKMLIDNHTDADKGKIKGYLYLEDIFGFCKTFKKVTKNLGFHVMFKTANLQDIIYTSMEDEINVTINSLYLYIPKLIPGVETQIMFNEATQNNYKISFDEWYTERRIITHLLIQHDIGSAQNVIQPKFLICAHQTNLKTTTPDKKINIAIFDNMDLRKYYVEIDGQRYPRDSVLINYEENDYIQKYKDLKLFWKEYIGEPILNPLISFLDMKTEYPFEIIGLRHQSNHVTPKKFQLFHEYGADPDNTRMFVILIRRREIELISDGNKLIEVKVI